MLSEESLRDAGKQRRYLRDNKAGMQEGNQSRHCRGC